MRTAQVRRPALLAASQGPSTWRCDLLYSLGQRRPSALGSGPALVPAGEPKGGKISEGSAYREIPFYKDSLRTFSWKTALALHPQSQTGAKCYNHKACKKNFWQKSAFSVHLRIYLKGKAYQCSECRKASSHMSGLCKHEVTHNEEEPYECLTSYQRSHTWENPSECKTVGKLSCKSSLMCHHRMHRELPYENPDVAELSTINQMSLGSGDLTGEKPCDCQYCGVLSARRSSQGVGVFTQERNPVTPCSQVASVDLATSNFTMFPECWSCPGHPLGDPVIPPATWKSTATPVPLSLSTHIFYGAFPPLLVHRLSAHDGHGGHVQVGAPVLDTGINGRRHEDARTARIDRQNYEDQQTNLTAAPVSSSSRSSQEEPSRTLLLCHSYPAATGLHLAVVRPVLRRLSSAPVTGVTFDSTLYSYCTQDPLSIPSSWQLTQRELPPAAILRLKLSHLGTKKDPFAKTSTYEDGAFPGAPRAPLREQRGAAGLLDAQQPMQTEA
ncbi:Zinc finger protein 567 [Galemys pyrenaicus]|uniref:Zinc finger protein 567 n=1 Tax=Galemys pyrenaicus TaxID=202257 RepID=A0A8J6A5K6_GALPY|nr:Zinc finger protein 567 [Galemys pyrenaicus]